MVPSESYCAGFFTESYCAGVSNKPCLLTFFILFADAAKCMSMEPWNVKIDEKTVGVVFDSCPENSIPDGWLPVSTFLRLKQKQASR